MQFIYEERRVSGARYYTVHPVIEPVYDQNPEIWRNMMSWMIETFGPTPDDGVWTPGGRWYANNAKFWFRYEADLTLFMLRWS